MDGSGFGVEGGVRIAVTVLPKWGTDWEDRYRWRARRSDSEGSGVWKGRGSGKGTLRVLLDLGPPIVLISFGECLLVVGTGILRNSSHSVSITIACESRHAE